MVAVSPDSSADVGLRSTRDGAFCWQSKPARRRIREGCDAAGNVASRLGVYDALTEIASDEAREEFTTTIAHIAARSGFADRCVRASLKDLADLGVIEVETPALKAPSRYRLLSVRQTVPNDGQSKPDVRLFVPSDRHSANSATMPTVEERPEENKKTRVKKAPAHAPDGAVSMPESLNTPAFLESWTTWVNYWSEAIGRGAPMPAVVARKHLGVLAPLGAAVAMQWLDNAICRGLRSPVEPFGVQAAAAPRFSTPAGCASASPAAAASPSSRGPIGEPAGWREFLETECPGSVYARGGDREASAWLEIDPAGRAWIENAMKAKEAAA